MTDFAETWKTIVAAKDMQGLFDILNPDVVFCSPAVFKPYHGREAVTLLLANVIEVFGELTYTQAYANDEGGVMLQFETDITAPNGKTMHLEGVDIFQVNEYGRVQDMRVMIRPLSGLQALAGAMQAKMQA